MANKVFANGREISCKAAKGKTICAFPDVCFTPPENPATPPGVPIPYPNTGMASDMTSGSKTVKISDKEVGLKNKSYFKKSMGDEAGCAAKKGVVTSANRGKVYFKSWSMDVKIEGKNVVRHLDMTTNNHKCDPGDTPPWVYLDSMAFGGASECEDEQKEAKDACKSARVQKTVEPKVSKAGNAYTKVSFKVTGCSERCKKAQKCLLVPKRDDKKACCDPANTGHHMIEDHWTAGNTAFPQDYGGAPTVCAEGTRYTKDHGELHCVQGVQEESFMAGGKNFNPSLPNDGWNYGEGKSTALLAHDMTFNDSGCSRECLRAQLDSFYGDNDSRPLNPPQEQKIAQDSKGDDRWLRPDAENVMASFSVGS